MIAFKVIRAWMSLPLEGSNILEKEEGACEKEREKQGEEGWEQRRGECVLRVLGGLKCRQRTSAKVSTDGKTQSYGHMLEAKAHGPTLSFEHSSPR